MNIESEIEAHVRAALPDAIVEARGGGGHFVIRVVSSAFAGKRLLQKHQLVLQSIKGLMAGDAAPVHAVDQLTCLTPDEAGS
jgi:acid stress-induced BolA-like protein IbaG/YrbA